MKRVGARRSLSSAAAGYDSNAAAFFAVVTTLTASQKSAVNAFIVGAKSDGWWDKLDRIYINVGTTIGHHAYCLKTLTQRTAVNSPTWSARGTTYNGTSNYFRGDAAVNTFTNLSSSGASQGTFVDQSTWFGIAYLQGVYVADKYYYLNASVGA